MEGRIEVEIGMEGRIEVEIGIEGKLDKSVVVDKGSDTGRDGVIAVAPSPDSGGIGTGIEAWIEVAGTGAGSVIG